VPAKRSSQEAAAQQQREVEQRMEADRQREAERKREAKRKAREALHKEIAEIMAAVSGRLKHPTQDFSEIARRK